MFVSFCAGTTRLFHSRHVHEHHTSTRNKKNKEKKKNSGGVHPTAAHYYNNNNNNNNNTATTEEAPLSVPKRHTSTRSKNKNQKGRKVRKIIVEWETFSPRFLQFNAKKNNKIVPVSARRRETAGTAARFLLSVNSPVCVCVCVCVSPEGNQSEE